MSSSSGNSCMHYEIVAWLMPNSKYKQSAIKTVNCPDPYYAYTIRGVHISVIVKKKVSIYENIVIWRRKKVTESDHKSHSHWYLPTPTYPVIWPLFIQLCEKYAEQRTNNVDYPYICSLAWQQNYQLYIPIITRIIIINQTELQDYKIAK